MKRRLSLLAASSLLVIACAVSGHAATRPHYGGTLRVHLREPVVVIDPAQATDDLSPAKVQAAARIYRLLFDTLVSIDERGKLRSALAVSWQSDAQHQVWNFVLRQGVSFSDGSALTAKDVLTSLTVANPKWKIQITAGNRGVTIDTGSSTPELLATLALPRNSIYRRTVQDDLLGSGAFRITQFEPGTRILLQANDSYWGGRPYLDAVEVTFGGNIRDQLLSARLDRDQVMEVTSDQTTPLTRSGQRVYSTAGTDLYAITFPKADGPSALDPRVREALALTLDRDSINNVLLQKQGESFGALLPQWMTGYAFLMQSAPDPERARKLRIEAALKKPLPFAYDASDAMATSIAERIAVNAREAGIMLQPYAEKNMSRATLAKSSAQLALVRIPLASSDPAVALTILMPEQDIPDSSEELIQTERNALGKFNVIPVAHVPESVWLSPKVHNWTATANGDWDLQDVWLDPR